ncbi:alpha/beta hydrolase fold domain-containing protein [Streptomyces sp. BE230]|uniref:alpha/beta hydrolase fold domain-containing protein n=1 Tax=Streptomyces sp. BE230 TaxID=3002526 RepID=UPI002ED4EE9D|nr:alpha/beta hydrolase fold domain-containing protein [Streptomyces sp. BE230]
MHGPGIRPQAALTWETVHVAASGRTVPARVLRPKGPHRGWLVWAHGGSWRSGSAGDWHEACADLALHASYCVVSVDYRLAPKHRHPAALEDVLAVVDWAQEQAERAGVAPVAVGGDSAGATLAACAAVVRRDRGLALSAQVLAYPPLDPSCRAPSYTRYVGNFPTPQGLAEAWREYRGGPDAGDPPGLPSTPLWVEDLSGLAPAILGVGVFDPVLDDVRHYAGRLRSAGNDLVYQEFASGLHGAFLQPPGRLTGPDDPSALRRWLGTSLRDRRPAEAAASPPGPAAGPGPEPKEKS